MAVDYCADGTVTTTTADDDGRRARPRVRDGFAVRVRHHARAHGRQRRRVPPGRHAGRLPRRVRELRGPGGRGHGGGVGVPDRGARPVPQRRVPRLRGRPARRASRTGGGRRRRSRSAGSGRRTTRPGARSTPRSAGSPSDAIPTIPTSATRRCRSSTWPATARRSPTRATSMPAAATSTSSTPRRRRDRRTWRGGGMTPEVIARVPSLRQSRWRRHRHDRSGGITMPTYALAHLYDPAPHPEVVEYIERIQDTLDPYGGRFLVHGAEVTVVEGDWPGTIVILEFPDREQRVQLVPLRRLPADPPPAHRPHRRHRDRGRRGARRLRPASPPPPACGTWWRARRRGRAERLEATPSRHPIVTVRAPRPSYRAGDRSTTPDAA